MNSTDPLEGIALARSARWVGFALIAVVWFVSAWMSMTVPNFGPSWFLPCALGLTGCGLLAGLVGRTSRQGPLWQLRFLVVAALVVTAVQWRVWQQPVSYPDYPPTSFLLVTCAGVTGLVFGWRAGVPLVLVKLVLDVCQRTPVVGLRQSLGEMGYDAPALFLAFVVVDRLHFEVARVRAAGQDTTRSWVRAELMAERVRLQERWDGLIHDTVLAALRIAARGRAADAAIVARNALHRLEQGTIAPQAIGSQAIAAPEGNPVAAIEAVAATYGLEIHTDLNGWPSGDIGVALETATCEALRNVAQHSGVRKASVKSWLTSDPEPQCWVEVVDRGHGFDPSRVPERRMGIRHRMGAALRSVGGDAELLSVPGAGTTVRLRAPLAERPRAAVLSSAWSLRTLWPLTVLSAIYLGSGMSIGLTYLPANRLPWLSILGMITIPILTVALAFMPISRAWWACVGAMPVVWIVLYLNLRSMQTPDWRLWFVGSLCAAVAAVTLRSRLRVALVAITAGVVGSSLGLFLLDGHVTWAAIVSPFVQVYSWTLVAAALRWVMDRLTSGMGDELQAQARAEAATLVEAARGEEMRRRQAGLSAEVVPMLQQIASGVALTEPERQRALQLEAGARDHLVAGTLLTRQLSEQIDSARRRGARVLIAGREESGQPPLALAVVAVSLLEAARAGDRVQLAWRDFADGRRGSASLVGESVGDLVSGQLLPAHVGNVTVETSIDDDAVLVEFS